MRKYLTAVVCVVSVLLTSCRKKEITVNDLIQAQGMVPFMVELPKDIQETDSVCLELFGEAGVVDSAVFAQGLKPGEILKIFIHKENGDYRFSVITDSSAMNDIKLKYGQAELRVWRGNSHEEVFQVGDPLAGFTLDDSVSYMSPSGDDVSLRVAIRRGSEQVVSGNAEPATR